jgi:hypothetical protein
MLAFGGALGPMMVDTEPGCLWEEAWYQVRRGRAGLADYQRGIARDESGKWEDMA